MGNRRQNDRRMNLANARAPQRPASNLEHMTAQQGVSRRQFLEATGFSLTLAMAGCGQAPTQTALPLPDQPAGLSPGIRQAFASTCGGCSAACGLLVSVQDGRPLKMEGLPEHPLSQGGLCAIGQAQTIELYDNLRLRDPLEQGQVTNWESVDRAMTENLANIRRDGGAVRFVTATITSPTLKGAIDEFLEGFSDGKHITCEQRSCSAILDAHLQSHGRRVVPRYLFEQADVIVSFGADFLGTWISPVEFTAGWRKRRVPTPESPVMSKHVQLEGRMSLTGTNADQRFLVAPDEYGNALSHLASRIMQQIGAAAIEPVEEPPVSEAVLDDLARQLTEARGSSLVLCDSQDTNIQLIVNAINQALGNYGQTIDLDQYSQQRQESDTDLLTLLDEIRNGTVAALFVAGNDLLHSLPKQFEASESLKHVPLVVSFAQRVDATASAAKYICPDHHPLESWLDAEPTRGVVSMQQPTIRPMGNTRSMLESLAAWQDRPTPAFDLLQQAWQQRAPAGDFQTHWERTVHDGLEPSRETDGGPSRTEYLAPTVELAPQQRVGEYVLELYSKVGMPDARHAHNPWLHELPDPVTKITWDNYVSVSPATAERLSLQEGDIVEISTADGANIALPAHVQIGQHDRVLAVALGYGAPGTDRFAGIGPDWLEAQPTVKPGELVGVNAADLIRAEQDTLRYVRSDVTLRRTGGRKDLAATQLHHRLEVPPMVAPPGAELRHPVQRTTLDAYANDPGAGAVSSHHLPEQQLWPEDHPKHGHWWGMIIDLNACTGCSACVVACQAENNIPVVGKDEVRRQREMHWMRIDRYYSGEGDDLLTAHQPMMCHHCDNAPCETVCPVLATTHSDEGINEQTYNRCVGTRYCANNCPYKVRRFNWFEYSRDSGVLNLALNPDVTVRSRGVMEKCTMCVQRIEAGRIASRRSGERISDGQVLTACQQSCPAQAITFGDRNDHESLVSQAWHDPRAYFVLEELNVRPSVGYLRQVKNRPGDDLGPQSEASHD